jgi:hypothetical protein
MERKCALDFGSLQKVYVYRAATKRNEAAVFCNEAATNAASSLGKSCNERATKSATNAATNVVFLYACSLRIKPRGS